MRCRAPLALPPAHRWPALTPSTEVAAALGRRLGLPAGMCRPVHLPRAEARSTVHFLGTSDEPELCRWVVKQPRTTWSQDDVASPVTADQEFAGLQRLSAHFAARGGAAGVPAPIALLPEVGGLATSYVRGHALSDLLHSRSVRSPAALTAGACRAADFLRGLHELEALPGLPLSLAQEAEETYRCLRERLAPAGLSVPPLVARALAGVPATQVTARQVWLHGDCTPANFLLPDDRTIVGIDIDLRRTGTPEDDLARFIAFVSGSAPFMTDATLPDHRRRHRALLTHFLERYGADVHGPVLELRLLRQLAGRWLRLRQLARLHGRPALLPVRLQAVDVQVRSLLVASARRLTTATRDPRG